MILLAPWSHGLPRNYPLYPHPRYGAAWKCASLKMIYRKLLTELLPLISALLCTFEVVFLKRQTTPECIYPFSSVFIQLKECKTIAIQMITALIIFRKLHNFRSSNYTYCYIVNETIRYLGNWLTVFS